MTQRAVSGRGWAATLLLAVCFLAAAAGCSDDGGGGSGDTSQDVAFDSPGDTAGDPTADTDDATDDLSDDTPPDADDDGADGAPDGEDDAPTDLVEEIVPDTDDDFGSDPNIGDQPDDLGTNEYPVCPYETPSATADCGAVCAAVVTCDGAEAEAFCEQFCATALDLFNQAAATAFASCITSTSCETVPAEQDLGFYCFVQSLTGLAANPDGSEACATVDAAIETCTGEDSSFGTECETIAPVLRSETAPLLEACALEPCDSIENCVSAAVCDILL